MSGWDMIVFTKDWHPLEHISFVTNAHRFKQHLDSVVSLSVSFPIHCVLLPVFFSKEVAGVTLCNDHKEYKRAKSECSFTVFLFFILSLGLMLRLGLG